VGGGGDGWGILLVLFKTGLEATLNVIILQLRGAN
jgi:hypothetical protein